MIDAVVVNITYAKNIYKYKLVVPSVQVSQLFYVSLFMLDDLSDRTNLTIGQTNDLAVNFQNMFASTVIALQTCRHIPTLFHILKLCEEFSVMMQSCVRSPILN